MSSSVGAGASGGGGGGGKNKNRWPEVVGLLAEEAAKVIKQDMSGANIEVIPADEPVTMDLVPDRVRLFVDTVAKTPTVQTTFILLPLSSGYIIVRSRVSACVLPWLTMNNGSMELLLAGGAGAGRAQELVAGGGRDERRGSPGEDPQAEA
jgi:hypothetical protein